MAGGRAGGRLHSYFANLWAGLWWRFQRCGYVVVVVVVVPTADAAALSLCPIHECMHTFRGFVSFVFRACKQHSSEVFLQLGMRSPMCMHALFCNILLYPWLMLQS